MCKVKPQGVRFETCDLYIYLAPPIITQQAIHTYY